MTALVLLVAFAVAAAISWLLVGRVLLVARRRLLDVPSERSSHDVPTPRGAGVGVVLAVVACGAAWTAHSGDLADAVPVAAALVMALVGLADDRRPMTWPPKLALLLLAAAIALPAATVRAVAVPFAGEVDLGLLALPLSLAWLCGFSNGFNFMDGIDGISGLTAVVAATAYALAAWTAGDAATAFLGAAVAGAAAGFLPWNLPRARIFLGDSGSLPLGLLLAVLAVRVATPRTPGAAPAMEFPAAVLVLGPHLFDVTFTLVRRAREGKPLGLAHKEHLYQRLARAWASHPRSALAFAGLTCGTAALAFAYGSLGDAGRAVSLLAPPLALLASAPRVFEAERRRAGA